MTLTPATQKDIKKVFDWRNSLDIRRKGNGQKVEWAEHKRWYDSVLADKDKLLLIIEEAGAVRLEREGKQCEISVYVCEHKRGQGLGKAAIEEATRLAFCTWPSIDEIIAIVKYGNHKSRLIFLNCGYLAEYVADGKDGFYRMVNRER